MEEGFLERERGAAGNGLQEFARDGEIVLFNRTDPEGAQDLSVDDERQGGERTNPGLLAFFPGAARVAVDIG